MTLTNVNPQPLIDQVATYYVRYLSASPEHLDLLALWTLHTYCFQDAAFSPSLNITSRHKQSGKTLCLQLLNDLCSDTWLYTSPSPALVLRQTQGTDTNHPFTGTLLLDDCHITTRLRGVLTAGFHWTGTQIVACKDRDGKRSFEQRPAFFPKAFVSNGYLPDSLKDVSIPISLEPKQRGSPCRRFSYDNETSEFCRTLRRSLYRWGQENSQRLADRASYEENQFPLEFSSRQQDLAEPLLQVADLIGGDWPQRARNALISIFALSAFEDFYSSRQVLFDLREAFHAKDDPQWISTADLLEFLHTMDDRTWDEWNKGKPMNPKDLATLLKPFGIRPANQRLESGKVIKGYKKELLDRVWVRQLLLETWGTTVPTCGEEILSRNNLVAANPQNSSTNIPAQQLTPGAVAAEMQEQIQPAARPCPELSAEGSSRSGKFAKFFNPDLSAKAVSAKSKNFPYSTTGGEQPAPARS
ncbi:MAG TPA: DUF3631 domain-containing protein [Candidatus Angelobacter sp.]|jgi:putative DNA primase/helicase|nr:DUF3631 domain-containing protein [Candidatus Angelobacter sp.]